MRTRRRRPRDQLADQARISGAEARGRERTPVLAITTITLGGIMPRRNYRPEQRAAARRLANQEIRKSPPPREPREALLPMVKTEGTCPTGKMRYGSADDAREALRRAWINREILQSPVV